MISFGVLLALIKFFQVFMNLDKLLPALYGAIVPIMFEASLPF